MLELYDRRLLIHPDTRLRLEVVIDDAVAAWITTTATRHDREDQAAELGVLHGRLLGHDWFTALPALPDTVTRVDLDLDLDLDLDPDDPMPDLVSTARAPRP